jgi:AraC-like DNA-binding protein
MSDSTVAANAVRALLEFAVSRGAERNALLDRARISSADLQNPDDRVPFGRYVALMRAGQQLCKDPALALHFGEAVDISEVSPLVGQLGGGSATRGFALVNRFAPLTIEVDGASAERFQLARIVGQLWLVDTRKNANAFPELTESAFARTVCSARRALGQRSYIKAVHVTHAAPAYRDEYDRIFQMPVAFESDKNALLMDEGFLGFQPTPPPRYVSDLLSAHAEALLEKLEGSKSTRSRVESLLLPALSSGEIGSEAVAKRMSLSRQTLFRKLKAEGVTFEQVLDELRHALALQYVGADKLSVKRAASLLGFSDPSAFSRAFKRWTGSNPKAYGEAYDERRESPSG